MYGLSDLDIKLIQEVFSKHNNINRVFLYGSRAKGNYKIGSDIDLTIEGNNLTLTDLFMIENELDDINLPYKIDLSLLHQIENSNLLDHIHRVGIEFYKK